MAQTTFSKKPFSTTHVGKQAIMGLSVASLLSPIAVLMPANTMAANAQLSRSQARTTQIQRTDVVVPPRSTAPMQTTQPTIKAPGDGGGSTADGAGSCSGVSDCNNFIAICVGGGGTYVPGTHNDEGQPTSGSCDVD